MSRRADAENSVMTRLTVQMCGEESRVQGGLGVKSTPKYLVDVQGRQTSLLFTYCVYGVAEHKKYEWLG